MSKVNNDPVPIADAHWEVRILKSPMRDKAFYWTMVTADNIRIGGWHSSVDDYKLTTSELAKADFVTFAEMNGIKNYNIRES
jgi:hypothetical protein